MGVVDLSDRSLIEEPASAQQRMIQEFFQGVKTYVDERLEELVGSERAAATRRRAATRRDISEEDILLRFTHHVPLDQQVRDQHDAVRENFKEFAMVLQGLPPGREKSLAYTALEEASFWAHAAVARQKGIKS